MKVDFFYVAAVNLGLGSAKSLKYCNCSPFRPVADMGVGDDFANLAETASVFVIVGMALLPLRLRASGWIGPEVVLEQFDWLLRMRMLMGMRMLVPVLLCLALLFPVDFAGKILLAVRVDIRFGGGNSAASHAGDFQARANVERGYRFFKQCGRNSGINERAHKHVATHSGETFQVGNAHRTVIGRQPRQYLKTAFHHREALCARQTAPRRLLCYNHFLLQ